MMTSNGLASGNHVLEAISHGICEVVERHANAMWQIEAGDPASERRRIRLQSVEDECCRQVLDRFSEADILVAAWEITSDIAIPTIVAQIVDARDDPGRLLFATSGLGCHPCPSIALLRALTEAAQCRLTYIAGARDDADREIYEQARNAAVIERARRRLAVESAEGVSFETLTDHSGTSFEDDVQWELSELARAGVPRALVVDLTDPRLAVPVVRVVIPGLEGIFDVPGYVPGPRALAKMRRRQA
jgi:ribosomal protein S12 methylthiotransferase accessory factor